MTAWVVAQTTAPVQEITLWRAVVIGIVQGLTEFLPISSTAHVKVVPVMLGWGDPGVSFTAVIQLGSIVAILWYFWDDLSPGDAKALVKAIMARNLSSSDFRLGLGILLGTVPIVVMWACLSRRLFPAMTARCVTLYGGDRHHFYCHGICTGRG